MVLQCSATTQNKGQQETLKWLQKKPVDSRSKCKQRQKWNYMKLKQKEQKTTNESCRLRAFHLLSLT